jgi:hypothetical protein
MHFVESGGRSVNWSLRPTFIYSERDLYRWCGTLAKLFAIGAKIKIEFRQLKLHEKT